MLDVEQNWWQEVGATGIFHNRRQSNNPSVRGLRDYRITRNGTLLVSTPVGVVTLT